MQGYTPVWVLAVCASVLAFCGVCYALVKLADHVGDKWIAFRQKKRQADREMQEADERSSTDEAWQVVDRLTNELQRVEPRIQALERQVDECRQEHSREKADHAGTKKVLRLVVAWGKSLKMKLPPEMEELLYRNGDEGSEVHQRLPPDPTPPVRPQQDQREESK